MTDHQERHRKIAKKMSTRELNLSSTHTNDESLDWSVHKYKNDKDFDEAFKNLLRPFELIAKKNNREPLNYDLLKELDSYLKHLQKSSDGGSSVFVDAALMFQNVIFLYQKRADLVVDYMENLVRKLRSVRLNSTEFHNVVNEIENVDGNTRKKREKKIKFYSSFEPIKKQILGSMKKFDCKVINLSKKHPVPTVVLNANVKEDNKYSQILPYICIGNGENIGKKYDFKLNCPLNRDLAVSEEFDCPTIENQKNATTLKYRKSTDPLPMNLMDDDEVDSVDIYPSTPDPVVFEQTIGEICAHQEMATPVLMNLSEIPILNNDDEIGWESVTKKEDNHYVDIPLTKKKEDNRIWLPTHTIAELVDDVFRLKSGIVVDPAFRKLIYEALEIQKSEIAKKRNRQIIEEEKKKFDFYDKEMEERLRSGEEPGFSGFDTPIYDSDFDDIIDESENRENLEIVGDDANEDNFQTYQKNVIEMQKHEQNQKDTMNDQLAMRKRVQLWHDNLWPILEEQEKRIEFDIHEYGTRILNCFSYIGERKSFEDLVGGLEQEEVARYYLSILMMTNTYNLKIINDKTDNSEMLIELLKKERHHEELQVNIGNQVNQEPN